MYDITTSSGARSARLQQLLKHEYYGRINLENAKKIISDHYDIFLGKEIDKGNSRTICRHTYEDGEGRQPFYPHGSLDSKVVDSSMAKKMRFIGRFGPGCGRTFDANFFKKKHPEYKKMVLNSMNKQPWTKLG
jgi:hypothetical protein